MKEDSNHALVATWALIFRYLFISVDADILCSNKKSLESIAWDDWKDITASFANRSNCSGAEKVIDFYELCETGLSQRRSIDSWNAIFGKKKDDEFVSLEYEATMNLGHFLKTVKKYCYSAVSSKSQRKLDIGVYSVSDIEYTKNDSKKWQEYAETLAVLYNHGVITVKEANLTKDLRIEPDLAEMISETGNEHILKWSWYAFRNNFTHKMRQPYIALQKLQNKYAKLNGKKSVAERWVRDYEMSLSEYKELIGQVVYDTMPLYRKLHAYVKFKLSQKYVYLHNWTHIPAHLLRNMWAQDWGHLINITLPFKELAVDSTQALKDKFKGNITALVKNVESYYVSIGFPHLPESFYNKSILEEGNLTKSVDCHASAHSMVYPRSDVRFKMCGKIDRDIFYTATHEMGHAYYYLSYSNQTFLFYNSPNPAFHESIGDTIALMSNGLTHFQKTHLLTRPKKKLQARMQRMNYLMLAALEKIPIIFFSYVIDKWVFDFYEDKVPESNMNGHWWYLVKTYQGIVPPNGEERGEEFFDVGAKYHVANLRYIYTRYQLARLLQFEFLRQLCKEDLTKGVPFDLCDAEGKVKATRRFREMLTLGASESWREQLKFVTNGEKDYFDTKVMLQYFKPLELWLDQFLKLNKISVGWQ